MKLYIVYSDKQFQLVDSVLFGQVRLAVCDVVETFFSDKDGSKIEKMVPYAHAFVDQDLRTRYPYSTLPSRHS